MAADYVSIKRSVINMDQYAFLTENMKHEALESLENTKRQLQQYNYPPAIVSAVELQKRIVSSLPLGMIVPLNQNYERR